MEFLYIPSKNIAINYIRNICQSRKNGCMKVFFSRNKKPSRKTGRDPCNTLRRGYVCGSFVSGESIYTLRRFVMLFQILQNIPEKYRLQLEKVSYEKLPASLFHTASDTGSSKLQPHFSAQRNVLNTLTLRAIPPFDNRDIHFLIMDVPIITLTLCQLTIGWSTLFPHP